MVFGAWPDSLWESEPIEPCHVHCATEMTLSMFRPSKGYFIRKSGSPGSLAVLFAIIFSAGFLSSIVYALFLGFCAHWRFIGFSSNFLATKVPCSSVSA
jgi:hypothetical protein